MYETEPASCLKAGLSLAAFTSRVPGWICQPIGGPARAMVVRWSTYSTSTAIGAEYVMSRKRHSCLRGQAGKSTVAINAMAGAERTSAARRGGVRSDACGVTSETISCSSTDGFCTCMSVYLIRTSDHEGLSEPTELEAALLEVKVGVFFACYDLVRRVRNAIKRWSGLADGQICTGVPHSQREFKSVLAGASIPSQTRAGRQTRHAGDWRSPLHSARKPECRHPRQAAKGCTTGHTLALMIFLISTLTK